MFEAKIMTEWVGSYAYSADAGALFENSEVEFEMRLKRGWFGRIVGEIIDGAGGIPERADLVGRVKGNEITFAKKYKRLWITDETNQRILVERQESHVIFYNGLISSSGQEIQGRWKIGNERRNINGVEFEFPMTTGSWRATSVKA